MNNNNPYSQKPQPPSNIPRMQQQTPSFPQQYSNSNANFTFGGQQQQSHSNNMPNPFGNSYQVQQQLPNVQPYSSQMQQDLFSFPQNNTNMSDPFSNQLQYQQQLPNPMPYQMQYSGPYQQLPNVSSYGYPQYQPNLTQLNDSNFVPADMGNLDYGDDEPIDEKTPVKPQTTSDQTKSLNDVIQLSMKIKQNTLQSSSFNEQTLPFLVSMKVESLKSEAKVPIDLVCVIDHSGSMGGEKIELVKNTFNFLLEYLDSSDRLSIIIFDDYASRLVPFIRTTEDNKKKILSALKNVYGNGGTDINLGLTHAFHALKKRRQTNPVSSIFLLSDGLDGGAQQKVKATLAKLEVPEDITINTFGYGRDHDPQLMTDIANLRDGNFYFIDKLDTVDEAFVDCLGGLINSIAQNAQIKIQPEQSEALNGVEIIKAYGDSSMWTHEGQTYTTKMATLMADKQKDYVLEIKIPKNIAELQDHQKSIKIASAEVTVTGLDNKQVMKNAELIITLLNETEEIKDQEGDDREVMKNFYRVKGAELLDNARKLADSNRNDEAKKLLQSFKEEVANSFLKEEEFIKNMIKDMDKALEYLNPVVYQDYGRHNMYSNQRAQMQQRTDLNMYNCNQMPSQAAMTNQVKAMKAQPNFGGFF